MKIAVLGAGGLGSVIGAHLVKAGEDVIFIARGERAAFLRKNGIHVTGLADFTVPVTVTADPQGVKEVDILLVAVKTYDTESALQSIRHLSVGGALSIQNGVLKDEQLAQIFGEEKTLGAATMIGGEVLPDGSVRFTLNGKIVIGELAGGTSERAQTLAATLARAGLQAEASPQIRSAEWSKYVWWSGFMVVAVLTRMETYKYSKDPGGALVTAKVIREVGQIPAKLGIPLEEQWLLPVKTLCSEPLADAVNRIRQFGDGLETRAPNAKPSTLMDLQMGRRLEVEETLGYAVRKGAELGIPLPTVDTCYRLIAAVNRYLR
jgi:2-dehydropantoate 2-reductase